MGCISPRQAVLTLGVSIGKKMKIQPLKRRILVRIAMRTMRGNVGQVISGMYLCDGRHEASIILYVIVPYQAHKGTERLGEFKSNL